MRFDVMKIGAIIVNYPSIEERLMVNYDKWLLLFNSTKATKLPKHTGCDHRIELIGPQIELELRPIYQLFEEEEGVLTEYRDKMIQEWKIGPSSSPVWSWILFIHKWNWRALWSCGHHRHLSQYTVKDKTPLPLMDKSASGVKGENHLTKIDQKAGFLLIQMALGHENSTASRTMVSI